MGTLYNDINWVRDGEYGTADVINRPLQQLVKKLDAYEYTNSVIPLADIDLEGGDDAVQDGDVVYRYESPVVTGQYAYGKAVFDTSTNNTYRKDKPFGVVRIYDGDWYLIFSGPVEILGSNFKVGEYYYLSDTEHGKVKAYDGIVPPGAVRIGKALTPTHLLVDIEEQSVSVQGSFEIPLAQVGDIVDSDAVYFNGTTYEKAMNDETEANRVVGIYKRYDQKHYVVYDGVIDIEYPLDAGLEYFLSENIAGAMKSKADNVAEAPNSVSIGRALTTSTLLVNINRRALPEQQLFMVHSSEVLNVVDGDFVYRKGNEYLKALSNDDVESAVVGIYKVYENKHFIVHGGVVEVTGVLAGVEYYLSDTVAGTYKIYTDKVAPRGVKLGRGLDDGLLLLEVQRHEYHENGVYEITPAEVGDISDSEFVFYNAATAKYEKAFNSGVNLDIVSGMYKIYDGRHYIVYDGLTEVTNKVLIPATQYYLTTDEHDAGLINTLYSEISISVGVSVDSTHLLIAIDRNKTSTNFFSLPVLSSEVGDIQSYDVVYKDAVTGKYQRALSDGSDADNAIGFYVNMGLQHYIIYAGYLAFPQSKLDVLFGAGNTFEIGKNYFLDANNEGTVSLSEYSGAIKVGTAISATELQVDIDTSTGGVAVAEAIEYEFFLQQSQFNRCYVNTFELPNTAQKVGTVNYVSSKTAYVAENEGDMIVGIENIFGNGNTVGYGNLYTYMNDKEGGYYDMEYSIDSTNGLDGTWLPTGHQKYIPLFPVATSVWVRFIRNATPVNPALGDRAYLYSYGILYDDDGITGMSSARLREYYEVPSDLPSKSTIQIPRNQKYTNDGKTLDVLINGIMLQYGVDYYEVDSKHVMFEDSLQKGWVIEFREYYGYVDVSSENQVRVDFLELERDRHDREIDAIELNIDQIEAYLQNQGDNSPDFTSNSVTAKTSNLVLKGKNQSTDLISTTVGVAAARIMKNIDDNTLTPALIVTSDGDAGNALTGTADVIAEFRANSAGTLVDKNYAPYSADAKFMIFGNGDIKATGTAHVVATSALYADVAENYLADSVYPCGTVLGIGGENEVTVYRKGMALAGVVSTAPAYIMNNSVENANNELYLAVALKGKIPCHVKGKVKKGQYIIAGENGKGYGVDDYSFEESKFLIGVALEDSESGEVMVKV